MILESLLFILLPAVLGAGVVIMSVVLAVLDRKWFQIFCTVIVTAAVGYSFLWLHKMFFTRAWPSYLPYLVIGLTVLIVLSQIGFFHSRPKSPRWWIALGFTSIWIGGPVVLYCNIGVKKTRVVMVHWQLSDAREDAGGRTVISLRGSQGNGIIASDKIADYLKANNPETIPVEIIRTYDFGKFQSWTVRKIAGISDSHLWLEGQIEE